MTKVVVDDNSIAFTSDEGSCSITWDELSSVSVRNAYGNPHWELQGAGRTCTIPMRAEGERALGAKLEALSGFDKNALTRAMCTCQDSNFVCWTKGRRRVGMGAPARARLLFFIVGIPAWYIFGLGSNLAIFAHEMNLGVEGVQSRFDEWASFAALMLGVAVFASYFCYRVSTSAIGKARDMGRFVRDGFGTLDMFEGLPTFYSACISLVVGVLVSLYFGAHYIDPLLQTPGSWLWRSVWGALSGGAAGALTGNYAVRWFLTMSRG